MLGLAFSAASDQFIMSSMTQVLNIPLLRPIMDREIKNRLYSPSAFYFASTLACFVILPLYPIFTAMISYWFFGFDNPDVYGMFNWMLALLIPAIIGGLWGFLIGAFNKYSATALQVNIMFIMFFNAGAG